MCWTTSEIQGFNMRGFKGDWFGGSFGGWIQDLFPCLVLQPLVSSTASSSFISSPSLIYLVKPSHPVTSRLVDCTLKVSRFAVLEERGFKGFSGLSAFFCSGTRRGNKSSTKKYAKCQGWWLQCTGNVCPIFSPTVVQGQVSRQQLILQHGAPSAAHHAVASQSLIIIWS